MSKKYNILVSEPWDVPNNIIVELVENKKNEIILKFSKSFKYKDGEYLYLIAYKKENDSLLSIIGVPIDKDFNYYSLSDWRGGLAITGELIEL